MDYVAELSRRFALARAIPDIRPASQDEHKVARLRMDLYEGAFLAWRQFEYRKIVWA